MTIGLSTGIQHHIQHHTLLTCKSPDQTLGTYKVDHQPCVYNFLQVLVCGYPWDNIFTLSPPEDGSTSEDNKHDTKQDNSREHSHVSAYPVIP